MNAQVDPVIQLLKLDLGCGPNPIADFIGLDSLAFNDKVTKTDLSAKIWTFDKHAFPTHAVITLDGKTMLRDSSVTEFHCSHFLEHLTGLERVRFYNELYRVLTPGGRGKIVTPHWASNRAYGDFTHQWPPVSEMTYYYLNKDWRIGIDGVGGNAPHNDIKWNQDGYTCDFDASWGYGMHGAIIGRNTEYQNFAMAWFKEACQDMHCTLVSKKK
jgi:Methyltransferase domain